MTAYETDRTDKQAKQEYIEGIYTRESRCAPRFTFSRRFHELDRKDDSVECLMTGDTSGEIEANLERIPRLPVGIVPTREIADSVASY